MLFGLAPAIETLPARSDVRRCARADAAGWAGFSAAPGAALVVGEITLAFVLVTGAALTARTLAKIEQAPPGFEPRQLLAFQIAGGIGGCRQRCASGKRSWPRYPGVERVGATSHLPLDTDLPNWYGPYRPEGYPGQDAAGLSPTFAA